MHVEQGGKPSIVHCDFKPANILLDESLRACLSDTGFARAAKTQSGGAVTTRMTTMHAGAFTPGFADPLTFNNGEFSVTTDGYVMPGLPHFTHSTHTPPTPTRTHVAYAQLSVCAFARGSYAVGITLLVCLTNRSPVDLVNACEEAHDGDFLEIPAEKLADPAARFPPHVADMLKDMALCKDSCLCSLSRRKRLDLPSVLKALAGVLAEVPAKEGAPSEAVSFASAVAPSGAYTPSAPSLLVREIGRKAHGESSEAADESTRRLQRNASNAFDAVLRRSFVETGLHGAH